MPDRGSCRHLSVRSSFSPDLRCGLRRKGPAIRRDWELEDLIECWTLDEAGRGAHQPRSPLRLGSEPGRHTGCATLPRGIQTHRQQPLAEERRLDRAYACGDLAVACRVNGVALRHGCQCPSVRHPPAEALGQPEHPPPWVIWSTLGWGEQSGVAPGPAPRRRSAQPRAARSISPIRSISGISSAGVSRTKPVAPSRTASGTAPRRCCCVSDGELLVVTTTGFPGRGCDSRVIVSVHRCG